MKKVIIITLIALLSAESFGAAYKITAREASSGGAVAGASSSYRIRSGVRGLKLGLPAGASFIIREGFFRMAYFSRPILGPLVTSVETRAVVDNKTLPVTIYGANFASGATVTLAREGEKDIAGTNALVAGAGKMTCEFNITGAKEGLWNLTVTNTDGRSGTLPSAVNLYSAPKVLSIKPGKAENGAKAPVAFEIAGENFREGAKVSLLKTGQGDIIGTTVKVESSARITCSFDLFEKSVGSWDVKVENENGQSGTLPAGLKIEKPEFELASVRIEKPAAVAGIPAARTPLAAASVIYELSKDTEIIIKVFNMRGENIWSYTAPPGGEGGQAGENTVIWNGITSFGSIAGAGVYFVRVYRRVGDKVEFVKQMKYGVVYQ